MRGKPKERVGNKRCPKCREPKSDSKYRYCSECYEYLYHTEAGGGVRRMERRSMG